MGVVDLIYGVFASPFFIENYIDINWGQSIGYCRFYEYIFSFHDLFIPLVLIALSAYVALKYSGTYSLSVRNTSKRKIEYLKFSKTCKSLSYQVRAQP